MSLIDECLEALGKDKKILSESDTQAIFQSLEGTFPFTQYSRIDWSKIATKTKVNKSKELVHHFKKLDIPFFILWDNARYPAIESNLESILSVIDDVTAVSFDTWLFSQSEKLVIEFNHDGEIYIGKLS